MLQKLSRAKRHLRDARPAHHPFKKRIVNKDGAVTDRQLNDAVRRMDDVAGLPEGDQAVFGAGRYRASSSVLQSGEEQRSERQHSDPAGLGAASDTSKRCFNTQAAILRHCAGNESECAAADIEQGGRLVAVTSEFFHDRARVVRQIKCRTVGKTDADLAASRGLEDIALADRVAGFDLKGLAAWARQRARPDDGFDLPDNQCRI
jgi:hypothetical protein